VNPPSDAVKLPETGNGLLGRDRPETTAVRDATGHQHGGRDFGPAWEDVEIVMLRALRRRATC
jgi:hypothetical protein